MKDCVSCTEYIKKMKSLEFKVNDVMRERDLVRNECTALSSQLAQTDREDQVNEVLRREVARQRKKNDVNEAVINELKKQLELYAYQIIKMQNASVSDEKSFGVISETIREDYSEEEEHSLHNHWNNKR